MRRRDFLKGLSAFVPATLLAKLALPKIEEVASVEAVEPDDIWCKNGGIITDNIHIINGVPFWDYNSSLTREDDGT